MSDAKQPTDRRRFLGDGMRIAGAVALTGATGLLAVRKGREGEFVWQIDPDKCIGCSNCATHCVRDISAVKCVNCFDMCGYCDICTGYFTGEYNALTTAAENQLCPTGAIERKFVEEKAGQLFYEYIINEPLCIGCGKCVVGCAQMNGSLYMQVMHNRCVNCNECSIAIACPTKAISRVPADQPEVLKLAAAQAIHARALKTLRSAPEGSKEHREARALAIRAQQQLQLKETLRRKAAAEGASNA